MAAKTVVRSQGRADCKGNAYSERQPDGSVRTTCDSCSLDWSTLPDPKKARA